MDAVIFGAALAAGLAAFYLVISLQSLATGTRQVIRARTLDEQTVDPGVRSPGRLRWQPRAGDEETELALIRAGWPIRVREFRILRLVFFGVGCVVGFWLASVLSLGSPGNLAVILVGGFLGSLLPNRYVAFRAERRLLKIEEQLPDALAIMSKSLKSGLGMLQAFDYTASQLDEPLAPEFQRTLRDLQLGGDTEVVFNELSRRVGSSDLDIATTAILIQRSVGGNLSEVLDNVGATIRERHQMREEVRVLTSRQRLTGNLVACVPVFICAMFFIVNPEVAGLLFSEAAGRISLAVGISFGVFGLWLIRKLAQIEV
jgi:tight adherence protein B